MGRMGGMGRRVRNNFFANHCILPFLIFLPFLPFFPFFPFFPFLPN
jgi:hypothetical protein